MSNTKIWGVRSGLIGDTIMALPSLTMLERKYPNSYKVWVIDKKCSQLAPIYLNHQLIDKIKVTDMWAGLGENDLNIMNSCDIKINLYPSSEDRFWWKDRNPVEQTLIMAGLSDYKDYLTTDDLYPKLNKWFSLPSSIMEENHAYCSFETKNKRKEKFSIAIFPFAHYGSEPKRSPTKEWWDVLCETLVGYKIKHFGWITEPNIRNTEKFTSISFFEQIKMALECDIVIGTDSGSMWVVGAYNHPSICVMTYHFKDHYDNPSALFPLNKNGIMMFNPTSCNMVKPKDVIERIKEYEEKNTFSTRYNIQ